MTSLCHLLWLHDLFGLAEKSWEFSDSFHHHFYSHQSKMQSRHCVWALDKWAVNAVFVILILVCELCFEPLVFFHHFNNTISTAQPCFSDFSPPTLCYTWRIMIVSVQQSSMWWELVGFMEMRTTTVHPCQFLCSICWIGCTWKVYFLNGWQTAVKAHFDTRGNLDSSINQLCFLENILI